MTQMFDSYLLDHHDLYHLRYGRGAVIVAVRKDLDEDQVTSETDKYVARLYNTRDEGYRSYVPNFEPVLSLKEEGNFVRLTVLFEHRHRDKPSYNPIDAIIERVIPLDRITLEIVRSVER